MKKSRKNLNGSQNSNLDLVQVGQILVELVQLELVPDHRGLASRPLARPLPPLTTTSRTQPLSHLPRRNSLTKSKKSWSVTSTVSWRWWSRRSRQCRLWPRSRSALSRSRTIGSQGRIGSSFKHSAASNSTRRKRSVRSRLKGISKCLKMTIRGTRS